MGRGPGEGNKKGEIVKVAIKFKVKVQSELYKVLEQFQKEKY